MMHYTAFMRKIPSRPSNMAYLSEGLLLKSWRAVVIQERVPHKVVDERFHI